MDFEEWLYADGMSASTVKKYAGAIRGVISEWAQSYQFTDASLDEILDLAEFTDIAEKVADTPEFASRNKIGNSMYSAALRKYTEFLGAISESSTTIPGPWSAQLKALERDNQTYPAFDPIDQIDARQKVLKEVIRRQGQSRFRTSLVKAYEAKCAFTNCSVLPALEAAHITPYLGVATNRTENGLLLRADIHTLWDLGLIALHPASKLIFIAETIEDKGYRALHGTLPFEPVLEFSRPSLLALKQQWDIFERA